ncbi:MAG: response regulator [Elusimicrobia bacterium]|nr:response regulator [Elusimicrobiota bacterium]
MEPSNDPGLADPKDKVILIVEDDESQRMLMKHIIEKEGFRVEEANDGASAVKQITKAKPDLVILDLMLPGKGGVEILRDLQAEGIGDVPVIIITARMMAPGALEMIRHEPNVREVMTKPAHPVKLPAIMHTLLKTKPPVKERTAHPWQRTSF